MKCRRIFSCPWSGFPFNTRLMSHCNFMRVNRLNWFSFSQKICLKPNICIYIYIVHGMWTVSLQITKTYLLWQQWISTVMEISDNTASWQEKYHFIRYNYYFFSSQRPWQWILTRTGFSFPLSTLLNCNFEEARLSFSKCSISSSESLKSGQQSIQLVQANPSEKKQKQKTT